MEIQNFCYNLLAGWDYFVDFFQRNTKQLERNILEIVFKSQEPNTKESPEKNKMVKKSHCALFALPKRVKTAHLLSEESA